MKKKRYQVRANREPRNPNFLGYPFAVIDTETNQIAMLANTRASASRYVKERENVAARQPGPEKQQIGLGTLAELPARGYMFTERERD